MAMKKNSKKRNRKSKNWNLERMEAREMFSCNPGLDAPFDTIQHSRTYQFYATTNDQVVLTSVDGGTMIESTGLVNGRPTSSCTLIRGLETFTYQGNNSNNFINNKTNDVTLIAYGRGGNDHLFGGGRNDTIHGGNGNDKIRGGGGNDDLSGDGGRDTIDGQTGTDRITGGSGSDTVTIREGDSFRDKTSQDKVIDLRLARLSINDVRISEGDSGTRSGTGSLRFTVTRSGNLNRTDSVSFSTQNGSASSGTDFRAVEGRIEFRANERTKQISVSVIGDNVYEPNETFTVRLHRPSDSVVIADGFGKGTILNDDEPTPDPPSEPSQPTQSESGNTNLALNGVASQSSTGWGGIAGRAIDNNTSGNWSHGSVTSTQNQSSSWWEVDLGQESNIDQINLFNRTDCCTQRLSDFTIDVLGEDDNVVWTKLFSEAPTPNQSIQVDATGNKVKVSLIGILSLAEVQVFGTILEPQSPSSSPPIHDQSSPDNGVVIQIRNGTLNITGTPFNDRVHVGMDATRTNFLFTTTSNGRTATQVIRESAFASLKFDAGPGDDVFHYDGTIRSHLPRLELNGATGNDVLHGSNKADTIRGGDGNDWIHGFNASDALIGGSGNDRIYGGRHHDLVYGGAGNDLLEGQDGNDHIVTGGQPTDVAVGGAGADTIRRIDPQVQILAGDWDGDGKDEPGFYIASERIFVLDGAAKPYFKFGARPGQAIVGNFDSDPTTEVGVAYAHGSSLHYTMDVGSTGPSNDPVHSFGFATDIPLVGDWDGNGIDDFGTFRQGSSPRYFMDEGARGWTGGTFGEAFGYQFGVHGDEPFVGDFNGDNVDEIGVYRRGKSGGPRYYLDEYNPAAGLHRGFHNRGVGETWGYLFGHTHDQIVIGDFDGDGRDDFAAYRTTGPYAGRFFIDEGPRGWQNRGTAEREGYLMGRATDKAFIGDWDGDRKTDLASFREASGRDLINLDLAFRGWTGASAGEWGF